METCNFCGGSAKGVGALVSVEAACGRPSGLGGVPRADDIRPYRDASPRDKASLVKGRGTAAEGGGGGIPPEHLRLHGIPPPLRGPPPFGKGGCRLRAGTPSQSALRLTAPPKGELGERFRKDFYLPLWGRWRGEAVTERALRGPQHKKVEVFYESHNKLQSLPI